MQTKPFFLYWLQAWRQKPRAALYSPWKAGPSLLIALAQFLISAKTGKPKTGKDMLITIAVIVLAYLILHALHSAWNFVALSPVKMHFELLGESSRLRAIAFPAVTPREQYRRELVVQKLERITQEERKVLLYILYHENIGSMALDAESGFYPDAINNAVVHGTTTELLRSNGDRLFVNPVFKEALHFVLENEAKAADGLQDKSVK